MTEESGGPLSPTTEEAGGPLSPAELDEFLAQPLLLKLACVRPDRWPYVVPLWFAWYERKLYVVGRERAVWIDYIKHEPRVGVLIDEDAARHRRVQMTATAAVVEGPAIRAQGSQRWHQLDRLLKGRYMADAAGQAYAQLTADRPRFLVEITPLQITSWRGGPWHRRYYQPEPAQLPPTAVVAN
jgi:nitroimidazol reductase NimA-like FMN-containing flavoprotein (pyridoxamine 5'-phosphate oxidase superfamily)